MKKHKELLSITGVNPPLDYVNIEDGVIEASNGHTVVQKTYKGEVLIKPEDFGKHPTPPEDKSHKVIICFPEDVDISVYNDHWVARVKPKKGNV
jgi:hypothetical protein